MEAETAFAVVPKYRKKGSLVEYDKIPEGSPPEDYEITYMFDFHNYIENELILKFYDELAKRIALAGGDVGPLQNKYEELTRGYAENLIAVRENQRLAKEIYNLDKPIEYYLFSEFIDKYFVPDSKSMISANDFKSVFLNFVKDEYGVDIIWDVGDPWDKLYEINPPGSIVLYRDPRTNLIYYRGLKSKSS